MFIALSRVLLVGGADFQKQLEIAGDNRLEIEMAIREVPEEQEAGMEWLLTHMPEEDLKTLTGEFLLSNCAIAYEAWEQAPWKTQITEELFFDYILPYASINERRDDWRGDFRTRFTGIVKNAKTPTEATVLLNQNIFDMVDVHYSTKRPKADQSPYESIDAGMASCTGLSILLIDACRSVGVPARFTGTPLWYNDSGNHNWVEFWDEGWHYTGGAEPTGDKVDEAWFDGSAAKATKGDPKHAIFAVTWVQNNQHFPLVWLPDVKTYGAIDVTDRYTKKEETELVPIRVRSVDSEGNRNIAHAVVADGENKLILEGTTKDENADANDHLTFMLPKGEKFTIFTNYDAHTFVAEEEIIVDISTDVMTKEGAEFVAKRLWRERLDQLKSERATEMETREIIYGDKTMPFWYTTYGEAPFGERSLWISMHGGGGATEKVNTQQWENQKRLYELEEGVYVVPRAPTDTWNLWHQSHIDPMFERLIENMIVFEGVHPNKVYIIGYSAGGDGVFQLAPRMADRLAGAGMMAGHPNETKPDGLRNVAFALHMGEEDGAYDRNKKAVEWKYALEDLRSLDKEGYQHQIMIHEGKGHWMDKQEAMALPWLAEHERNPFPKRVVWVQDDVLHDQMYWLSVRKPKERTKITASLEGQTITIHESDVSEITLYLNDELVDLDKPVHVQYKGKEVVTDYSVPRSTKAIQETLRDSTDWYSAVMTVDLPE
jgi:hypothetical protein